MTKSKRSLMQQQAATMQWESVLDATQASAGRMSSLGKFPGRFRNLMQFSRIVREDIRCLAVDVHPHSKGAARKQESLPGRYSLWLVMDFIDGNELVQSLVDCEETAEICPGTAPDSHSQSRRRRPV